MATSNSGSVSVRRYRGAWCVDVSTRESGGKRQRAIKAFGKGKAGKDDAEAYAAEMRRQLKAHTFHERRTMTFADLWADFSRFHMPEVRVSTAADYVALGKHYLLPHFGERPLSEIRVRDVELFREALRSAPGRKAEKGSKRALSDRSVAKLLTLLGTVFRYAMARELMDGNPAAVVKKPRAAKHVPYMFDAAEIARLRAALNVPAERLLVELAITTALRSDELRALTWENVDLEGVRLHVSQSINRKGEAGQVKTENSVRTVPLPAYLVPELKRWRLACPLSGAGYVFPGEAAAAGERGAIDADVLLRNVLRRALRNAGLPELRFHDLRHMAASLMVEAGVSIKRAQQILGHARERTTLAVYTHAAPRQHDDTADKIAVLAGLTTAPVKQPDGATAALPGEPGDTRETYGKQIRDPESRKLAQLAELMAPGWTRTNDQRINSGRRA